MVLTPSALGEFETLLLLAILQVREQSREAFGSAVRDEIERRTARSVPRGSIYVTLDRLEDKGLIASKMTTASTAPGQKPKRVFRVTPAGVRALRHSVSALISMHRGLEVVLVE